MALKLTINEPLELALLRRDPKTYKHGDKAPSYMYSVVLADSREDKLFATHALKETIEQLRIQPRQPFVLCRRKTPQGVEYFEVHARANSQYSNAIHPKPAAKETQAQSATEQPKRRPGSIMAAALIAAIDATQAAEQHAHKKGIAMEFGPADIRAIADTMFIAVSRDRLFVERPDKVA